MAEALAKKYLNNFIIESAGTNPEPINSLAIVVMKEINIDLSNQNSKSISDKDINSLLVAALRIGLQSIQLSETTMDGISYIQPIKDIANEIYK